MTNPFEQYGDSFFMLGARRTRKSHIAQSEKEAPMVLRGAEKAIAEDSEQMRRYKRIWRAEYQALLDGPHGQNLRALMKVLKDLTLESAPELFRTLEETGFAYADSYTRFLVLALIDEGICRMRVRNGLSPIDDSLLGEELTVFEICRSNLNREGEP
jgi:hypothetical protein